MFPSYRQSSPSGKRPRRAGTLPLIAICLPLFIMMQLLRLIIAYMQLSRTELRTATDAGSSRGQIAKHVAESEYRPRRCNRRCREK